MKKIYILLLFFFLCMYGNNAQALTDPYVKEQQLGVDLFLESPSLVWTPPDWFQPTSLASASEDANYWIHQVLPYEEDRYHHMYMVIPQLGSVMPIIQLDPTSADYHTMINGGQIDIDKYLVGGGLEYAGSVAPGQWGKRRDFAHSNNFRNAPGRYKTIFANLMALDPGDEVWYFVKGTDGVFDLFKYRVKKSYNTYPENVEALLWDGDGADALIFGCTHGLDGRWMIEATYIGEPMGEPEPYVDEYAQIPMRWRSRIDTAIKKMGRLPRQYRRYEVIQMFKLVDSLKPVANADELLIIEYIQVSLAHIFPE